jgi:hypothetical protein
MRKNKFCITSNNVLPCPDIPLSLDDKRRLVAEYNGQAERQSKKLKGISRGGAELAEKSLKLLWVKSKD